MGEGRELEHTGNCLFRRQVRCDRRAVRYVRRVAGREAENEGSEGEARVNVPGFTSGCGY